MAVKKRVKKISAMESHREKMVAALAELEDRQGRITPKRLVEAAREESHVFHSKFEWDDSIAAEKHREATARSIISTWSPYRVTEGTVQRREIRYVRDVTLPVSKQGYINVTRITDEDQKRATLIEEFSRAAASLQRAHDVAHVLNMQKKVQKLINEVDYLRSQSEQMKDKGSPARLSAN